ncbi:hypothetical protein KP509_27G000900 [Ceratopteris richardii]|nr:hypothetical protein KP509_27G000900 [Ceratopteris richardii]
MEELKTALEALHDDQTQRVEHQAVLELSIRDLELQLKQRGEELESTEREKVQAKDLLSNLETDFLDLQAKFNSVQEQLNEEISVQANQNQTLQLRVEELESASVALHSEKTRGLELQDILEKRLMEYEQQLEDVKATLELTKKEKAEVLELLSMVEANLLDLKDQSSSAQARLTSEVSALSEEKQSLIHQIEELKMSLKVLGDDQKGWIEQQAILEQSIRDLELQLKQREEALESTEREKIQMKDLLSSLETDFLDLQSKFTSVQERLSEEMSVQVCQNQTLQLRVEELETASAALHNEKTRGLELQEILEQKLIEYEQQLEHVKAALELTHKEKAEALELLSKVEADLLELKNQSSSTEARLASEVSVLSEEKKSLIHQLEELQSALAELHGEKSRGIELQDIFDKQIMELGQQLSQAKQEINNLSNELGDNVVILSHLQEEVNKREVTISMLKEDLLAKQDEGNALKSQLGDCSQQLCTAQNEVQKLQALLCECEDAAGRLDIKVKGVEDELESERMEANGLRAKLEEKIIYIGSIEGEIQGKEVLIMNLQSELSSKLEEVEVLKERVAALSKEKISQMEENSLKFDEIANLKEQLQHALETLSVKDQHILDLEMEYKVLIQDLEQKQTHHMQKCQTVTAEKERVEVELSMLQEARCKLGEDLAGMLHRAQQLELDLEVSKRTAVAMNQELAKVKTDIEIESSRAQEAEENNQSQKQLVLELREEKVVLLARLQELELLVTILQKELDDHKKMLENAHKKNEDLDVEILALKNEVLTVCRSSEEKHIKLEETISTLNVEISKLEALLTSRTQDLQLFERDQAIWYHERDTYIAEIEEKTNAYQGLEVEKKGIEETLHAMLSERDSAIAKCESFEYEIALERECRAKADAIASKLQAKNVELKEQIALLQTDLQELKETNMILNVKLEAAVEQERINALEIEALLDALQGSNDKNLGPEVMERSWHLEPKQGCEENHTTIRHLKERVLNFITDSSKIKQEVAAHAEIVKTLHLEIEKSGQTLENTREDYSRLSSKYEATITQLEALQSQITQFKEQVVLLEKEKNKLHDELIVSVRDLDQLSNQFIREQKELSEKLVSERDQIIELQEELKLMKGEALKSRRNMESLQIYIEGLLQDIEELVTRKEGSQEETPSGELQRVEESFMLLQENAYSICSLNVNEKKATELLAGLTMLIQEKVDMSCELQSKEALLSGQKEEIQQLQKELEESELRIQELQESSDFLSQKYDGTLADLESLNLQLSNLKEQNSRLELEVYTRTATITELTERAISAEEQNVSLCSKLKIVEEHNLVLQQELSEIQNENEKLKETLEAAFQKIQMLEDEISTLQQLHAKLQSDHEAVSIERQLNVDELNLTVSNLEKIKQELVYQQNEKERIEMELLSEGKRIEELEITISNLEKERKAFLVEAASTGLLLKDLQRRSDDLQEEVNRLRQELMSNNEDLREKTEKVHELSSMCSTLSEEKATLSMELETKIQAFGSLEASYCSLKDEHLSLIDKYDVLTEEAVSTANLILKLHEDISVLQSDKEMQDHCIIHRNAEIKRLNNDLSASQDSEKTFSQLVEAKMQENILLQEELARMKSAKLVAQKEEKENTGKLEIELKRLETVIVNLRNENISLIEQHDLIIDKYSDLEVKCKSLQRQMAELEEENNILEGQMPLLERLKKEALDSEEMVRIMKEEVANKQLEVEQLHAINGDLKEILRKFENEVENLKEQTVILQKRNIDLIDDAAANATLAQELDQRLERFKESKIIFEGGFTLAVGNVGRIQTEVDKLVEKISKLNELSTTKKGNFEQLEEKICKLQEINRNLRDELSALVEKEKSYVIAVRFVRAGLFCLQERLKAMKEEKGKVERAMEEERKKNDEVLYGLDKELVFLRDENKRQRSIISDRAEEKREAIRQLCATLDYMQNKNRRLEATINSTRDKIQRRIAASSTRRT